VMQEKLKERNTESAERERRINSRNDRICIRGARVHNLKNIDIDFPMGKITCIAGPSGSGKSTLAFKTLVAESKRRLLNSYPGSLKFFSERPAKVDVDEISPVLPVMSLAQVNPILGSRSNVGDLLGISEKIQSLYYNFSEETCATHGLVLEAQSIEEQLKANFEKKLKDDSALYFFVSRDDFLEKYPQGPFPSRSFDIDKSEVVEFDKSLSLWEVARAKWEKRGRLEKNLESFKKNDLYVFHKEEGSLRKLSSTESLRCPKCQKPGSGSQKAPQFFSAHNPLGACGTCSGHGATLEYSQDKIIPNKNLSIKDGAIHLLKYKKFSGYQAKLEAFLKKKKISLTKPVSDLPRDTWDIMYEGGVGFPGFKKLFAMIEKKKYKMSVRVFIRGIQEEKRCTSCHGVRISKKYHCYLFEGKHLNDIWVMDLNSLRDFLKDSLTQKSDEATNSLLGPWIEQLEIACEIGLGHLKLLDKAKRLTTSEYQRLNLLKLFSFKGTSSLFILDEPSLGLDAHECAQLMGAINKIKAQGNTVIIVEHNPFFHKNSDHFIMMGPGSGHLGGEVLYSGSFKNFKPDKKILKRVSTPELVSKKSKTLKIKNAKLGERSFPETTIELGKITWAHGASNSGKSEILLKILPELFRKEQKGVCDPSIEGELTGNLKEISDVLIIGPDMGQRTSRSTVGSVTGFSPVVRKHFADLPIGKALGLEPGHFSPFSVKGQCPECEGKGFKTIEMQLLEDVVLTCDACGGKRIRPTYAKIHNGHCYAWEAFTTPLSELLPQIRLTPKYQKIWDQLKLLRLEHLTLERPLRELSGGERQRLQLLSQLQSGDLNQQLVILENISFGLSAYELPSLAAFLCALYQTAQSIIVIDENPYWQKLAHCQLEFAVK